MTRPKRPTRLVIEPLERRDQPSVFGVAWPNAQALTLSFAPDGVKASPLDTAGTYSINELDKELNTHMAKATWQLETLLAFQAWAAAANVNIGLVNDNGTSFGDFERDLSQAPNGELRIGAVPLSPEVAAISTPYHVLTGQRAGDVLLNTAHAYSVGGANGTRDLYSVMLNEAANALGLEDTADPTSARYGRYTGVRAGLSLTDRLAAVALYGARPNDSYEGVLGNGTTALASPVGWTSSSNGYYSLVNGAVTLGDTDIYRVTTRNDTKDLFVDLYAGGVSLFTGKVELLNSSGSVIAVASTTNPLANDLSLNAKVSKNATYYVRVSASRSDDFGVGTYRLMLGSQKKPSKNSIETPAQFVKYASDNGSDDTIPNARRLTQTTPGFAPGTRFTVRGVLESSTDRDMYAVVVPAGSKPLTVVLDPLKSNDLIPEVHVFRPGYQWVNPTKLQQSADGRWVAQFPGLAPGETVYLGVKVIDGTTRTGEYELKVDFNNAAVPLKTLAEGNTSTGDPTHQIRMSVAESTFFHFAVESWKDAAFGSGTHVRMSIVDSTGSTVATLDAGSGVVSTQVFLKAGSYTVRFDGINAGGQLKGGAWYRWSGARISDPIDVYDPNSDIGLTPPVKLDAYAAPGTDDNDLWILSDPWSDPVG